MPIQFLQYVYLNMDSKTIKKNAKPTKMKGNGKN